MPHTGELRVRTLTPYTATPDSWEVIIEQWNMGDSQKWVPILATTDTAARKLSDDLNYAVENAQRERKA